MSRDRNDLATNTECTCICIEGGCTSTRQRNESFEDYTCGHQPQCSGCSLLNSCFMIVLGPITLERIVNPSKKHSGRRTR